MALAALLARAAAVAQEPDAPTSAAVSEPEAIHLLRQLEARHVDHRRVAGKFGQVRHDPVFLEDIHSSGSFYYERPNRFWCAYDEPDASSHTVIGEQITSFYPKFRRIERSRLREGGSGIGDVNCLMLAFGIEAERILRHFVVTTEPMPLPSEVQLTFVPRGPPEEWPFAALRLVLTWRDQQPQALEIVGAEGDWTRLSIEEIVWNPLEQPARFRLQFPREFEIIDRD